MLSHVFRDLPPGIKDFTFPQVSRDPRSGMREIVLLHVDGFRTFEYVYDVRSGPYPG